MISMITIIMTIIIMIIRIIMILTMMIMTMVMIIIMMIAKSSSDGQVSGLIVEDFGVGYDKDSIMHYGITL